MVHEPEVCSVCGRKIPRARLDALPGTDTCVHCSDEKPKTEADLAIEAEPVDFDFPEANR